MLKFKSIQKLFEEQVKKTPNHTAVYFEDTRLTYHQLNCRANELAYYLLRIGVTTNTVVAISVKRSIEMVIGLLGILKAGAAYVPLDPDYPSKRLHFMLQDTDATILLTQANLKHHFNHFQKTLICLDTDWKAIVSKTMKHGINANSNPEHKTKPEHLIYVMYTSGTTGVPKGVMNTHRGLANRLTWMQREYQLGSGDKVVQKTPFGFDVSVWEFFWPLIAGAQLVIAPPEIHKNPDKLAQLIWRYKISVVHFVPSMLADFVALNNLNDTCHSLRLVFASGEALPGLLADQHFKKMKAQLYNLYGPTEAAIDVSYYPCTEGKQLSTVPIGKPIANMRLYILDTHFSRVPTGVVGELCISGIGLARGYLNQPQLTAEKFINNPFAKGSYSRLYRTGDLARALPDGNIEFIGRIDEQIKIKGVRIELGEIEAVIRKHPAIKNVAVIVHEEQSDEKYLAVYAVPKHKITQETAINTFLKELQTIVANELPDYMKPSRFTLLEQLPLSLHGKLNKKNLCSVDELAANEQILQKCNRAKDCYPLDKTLHQLFEEQAAKSPDTTAIIDEQDSLTYRELNEQANKIAHYLIDKGAKAETLVAVHMEQCPNRVVILLGILKAGFAYVPLDPGYPTQRLINILNDSQASIVFSQDPYSKLFERYTGQVISLDTINPSLKDMSTANLFSAVKPDSLAYVIYTSGSTGKPKGVLGHHYGMVNRIAWGWQHTPYEDEEVCCHKTSLNFIDSVVELFSPLLKGINLVLVPQNKVKNPQELSEIIYEHQITRLVLVPSLLQILLDSQFVPYLSSLKLVIVSGERLQVALARRFSEAFPKTRLLNIYGSSEVAADATCYDLSELNTQLSRVPIGKPISNVNCYVLDTHLRPVPTGVVGELYIGGAGVAHGYLNQPRLTQDKFIPNPFLNDRTGQEIYQCLYQTGDLARFLPDGNLDYIGREDQQVKIRGVRVELGEIENALLACEEIKDVAVIAIDDNEIKQKRLIAFAVPIKNKSEDMLSRRLKAKLQKEFPDYMVPGLFIFLENIPLNPNGKIDKKVLAQDVSLYNCSAKIVVNCSDEIEKKLCSIWSELLLINYQDIGIKDNFFLLGGHSLLATLLSSRIKNEMNIELSIQDIFDHPTMYELIEKIKTSKELVFSAQEKLPKQISIVPLSSSQRSIWLLDNHLDNNRAMYNLPLAFLLHGTVDRKALERAFKALIGRHEILRTKFVNEFGIVQQIVLPVEQCNSFKLTFLNKPELLHSDKRLEHFRAESMRPFNLCSPPLVRIQLMHLTKEEYLLFMVIHHIVCDGWSLEIMISELSKFYNYYAFDIPHQLDSLVFQYKDFVVHQNQLLQKRSLNNQLRYWEKHLSNTSTVLKLPGRKRNAGTRSYQANTYQIQLDKQTNEGLKQMAYQHKASLFMVLLSGLYALFYRYTQQESFVIGTPVANRQDIDFENLIGIFVNTLALRAHVSPEDTFNCLLKQVREITLNAYHHQNLPFDMLVEHLKIERTIYNHPLVQVMLVLQNNKPINFNFMELDGQLLPVNNSMAKFDLTILAKEEPNGSIHLEFEYPVDLFDFDTVERMAHHYVILLKGVVNNPIQKIYELPLLSAEEKANLIHVWNHTGVSYPAHKTMCQLFEEQVIKSPDNTAIIYQQNSLTYRELNKQANQLAHYLIKLGVKPETLVAIHIKRGLDLIVALLGVLKAGGAYVPLDPNYTQNISMDILRNSQAKILLTETSLVKALEDYQGQVICLEEIKPLLTRANSADPKPSAKQNNLAYLIYTSGSTGKPKGVMIEHRGIVNIAGQASLLGINEKSRVLQFASINFDAFVWEWATTLSQGATLCLVPSSKQLLGDNLARIIDDYKITTATLPPSILATLPYSKHYTLETIIVAGEKHTLPLLNTWKETVKIFNAYGPTEATVCASIHQYTQNSCENNIGKPLPNCQLYILDNYLQPVPIGLAGELFIGGVGVARGYLKRKKLNELRFIKNPFVKNSKLYRTGDLARYLPDGSIEYIERKDRQIKLRGFRLEPGEIESVLRCHEMILDTVVVITDKKELLAYIIPTIKQTELAESFFYELKTWLEKRLPHYMVPNTFMFLSQFPLNMNGKVDIKKLPTFKNLYRGTEPRITPRNAIEENLVVIWSNLLGIETENLSIYDNFFKSGGHSLRAVQLLYEVNTSFPFSSLTVSDIFEHPTIASLSKLLADNFLSKKEFNVITIQKQGENPPLFLIHPSGGTALAYLSFSALKDRPVYGVSTPYFGRKENFSSIMDMASFYIQQIKLKHPTGPYYIGGWSFGGTVSLEIAKQLKLAGDQVLSVILIDSINTLPTFLEDDSKYNLSETKAMNFAGLIDIEQQKSQLLLQNYNPPFYLDSVILLKAKGNKKLIQEDTANDVFNGWKNLLPKLSVYNIAGTHDTLLNVEHTPQLIEMLKEILLQRENA